MNSPDLTPRVEYHDEQLILLGNPQGFEVLRQKIDDLLIHDSKTIDVSQEFPDEWICTLKLTDFSEAEQEETPTPWWGYILALAIFSIPVFFLIGVFQTAHWVFGL